MRDSTSASPRAVPNASRLWLEAAAVFLVCLSLSAVPLAWHHDNMVALQRQNAEMLAEDHADLLRLNLQQALSATSALAALVRQGDGRVAHFREVGRELVSLYPGVGAVQLAPEGIVQRSYPLEGNEEAIGHDLLEDPARTKEAFLARDSGKLTLAGPFELIQGGLGAVGRKPVYLPDESGERRFWGFTSVLVRFPDIVETAKFQQLSSQGYRYKLWRVHPDTGARQVIAASGSEPLQAGVDVTLPVPNTVWTLSMAPVGGWGGVHGLRPELGGVLVIASLATLLFFQLRRQPIRLRSEVARRTEELERSRASLAEAQRLARLGNWEVDLRERRYPCSAEIHRIFEIDDDADAPDSDTLSRRIHPADRPEVETARRQAVDAGRMFHRTYRLQMPDGRVKHVNERSQIEHDEQGHAVRVISTVQDITERVALEQTLNQERQRLADVLWGTDVGTWHWNVQTGETVFNERWAEIVGYTLDELQPTTIDSWAGLVHPDDLAGSNAELESHFAGLTPNYECEARMRHRDGHWVWVLDRGKVVEWTDDGRPLWISGTHQDITERKDAEESLRLAASVFEYANEGIMITAADGTILDVNEAFSRITGYARDEILGQNPRVLSSGRQSPAFYRALWDSLHTKGYWSGEVWNRRKSGEVYAERLTISAVHDKDGQVERFVALFSDITDLKAQQEQLEHIAHYDTLTGLPNRMLLTDRLHQAMAQAQRRGNLVAVLFLDLDGFKAVNDRYGHEAGDTLLVTLAERMQRRLREVDTLGRLGGDEFVALLVDLSSVETSVPILERLLADAAASVSINGHSVGVTASIGVTFFPQAESLEAEQLLRQADQAMYQAKQAGKSRYHLFDAEHDRSVRGRHRGQEHISRAFEHGEFVLHYQPKVNMRTGELLGAEALVRWQHPERGLLPPGEFLPLIEDRTLVVAIGRWVIATALRQVAEWQGQGLASSVSVNIDPQHLQHPDFAAELEAMLGDHPEVAPSMLELEILETEDLADMAAVADVIRGCRDLGVSFALDDFGTGYSSLAYLKYLPVSMIKVDTSFVRDMLTDPDDLAILEGVLGLAATFGHRAIAEGVETVAHGEMLLQMGCELGQGYAIARPMKAADLAVWARQWRPFSAWRGLAPVSRDDREILSAGVEHRAWVDQLQGFLGDAGTGCPRLDEHDCRLGWWLDAWGEQRHADNATFQRLRSLHSAIHGKAQELAGVKADEGADAAMRRFDEVRALHHELAGVLDELLPRKAAGVTRNSS